jgi:hypothetical protein
LAGGEDGFGDNAEFMAGFTNGDLEAEEMDPDNMSTEKTGTLSVADGSCFACVISRVSLWGLYLLDGSKVEA